MLESLINIIIGSLNELDKNLTGHSERVAYQMMSILKHDKRYHYEDRCKLLWIILLHDIGNYERRDVTDIIALEKDEGFSHARFGYFFLKEFCPYTEFLPVVLFQHGTNQQIEEAELPVEIAWAAKCLQVLDSVDLYRIEYPKSRLSDIVRFLESPDSTKRFDAKAIKTVIKFYVDEWTYLKDQKHMHRFLLNYLNGFNALKDKEQLLCTLVRSIDFRSKATALHCATVVQVSDMLAELFQLNEQTRQDIHFGAMLHDLGKIGTPKEILESHGCLKDKDWEIMKAHVIGTETLLRDNVSDEVLQIAIRHHERLNGKGYTRGLTAEDLTLPQRIVAVADIISALSSQRSYKEVYSLEKVSAILNDMVVKGEICPKVVEMFEANKEAIYNSVQKTNKIVEKQFESIYKDYENKDFKFVYEAEEA